MRRSIAECHLEVPSSGRLVMKKHCPRHSALARLTADPLGGGRRTGLVVEAVVDRLRDAGLRLGEVLGFPRCTSMVRLDLAGRGGADPGYPDIIGEDEPADN